MTRDAPLETVLDHLVVGSGGTASLAQMGWL